MKTFIASLSAILLATSFSFAHKGKALERILKPGKIRASSSMKNIGPKRITVPYAGRMPQPVLSIDRAALQRLEHNLNISLEPLPGGKLGIDPEADKLMRVSLSRAESPLKKILSAETVFRMGYLPEVKQANKLLTRIAQMKNSNLLFADAAAMQQLEAGIEGTVINTALKQYLRQHIQNQDYPALVYDLADYYTLTRNSDALPELGHLAPLNAADGFAVAAAGYLARHPHKINLKWRRLMTHPAVAEDTRSALQVFIEKDEITMQEFDELTALLKDAYIQHATALTALRLSPEMQVAVETYEYYLAELKNFIAENGRLPTWNTVDRAEQQFYRELDVLTMGGDNHIIEPLKSLAAEIRTVIAQYTPKPASFEETFARLETFVAEHHRFPAGYPNNPGVSPEEADLYNQYIHWELNGTSEQRLALRRILPRLRK